MKRRWVFFPVIGLFVLGILLGSFFDLQINQAIYDRYNGFGLFMAAFGETPVYAFMSTLGFGYIFLFKDFKKWWQRLILIVLGVAALGITTYFQGKHIFDYNAYNLKATWQKILCYAAGLGIGLLGALAGYFLFKNSSLKPVQLLFVIIVLTLVIGVSIGINQLTKSFMSRPRYRFLDEYGCLENFKQWWDMSGREVRKVYVEDLELVTKEEFKSFPSGHMTNTMSLVAILAMLPTICDKIKLKKEILFFIGVAWNLLLAFSRMLVGAHYLSDVSMGALLTILIAFVFNMIFPGIYNKITKGAYPFEKVEQK